MTHILITDLREIRYMAYVPENRNVLGAPEWYKDFDKAKREHEELEAAYRSDLEKAKRESIEFDKLKDRYVIMLNVKEKYNTSDPGIYQVPVEVEVVEILGPGWVPAYNDPDNSGGHPNAEPMQVARIVQPKEESQESIFTDVYQRLHDCLERGHGSFQSILSDFEITRKRG